MHQYEKAFYGLMQCMESMDVPPSPHTMRVTLVK